MTNTNTQIIVHVFLDGKEIKVIGNTCKSNVCVI